MAIFQSETGTQTEVDAIPVAGAELLPGRFADDGKDLGTYGETEGFVCLYVRDVLQSPPKGFAARGTSIFHARTGDGADRRYGDLSQAKSDEENESKRMAEGELSPVVKGDYYATEKIACSSMPDSVRRRY